MRAHIVVDDELIEQIDKIVGKRKRSAFIEEAIRTRLQREILGRAMQNAKGSLDAESHPEWDTPQAVADWVHNLRLADQKLEAERHRDSHSLPD